MGKNVLIVFAHNERKSFNGAILQATIGALEESGHNVVVSDLYGMNFKAVLSESDFKGPRTDQDRFNWAKEMSIAHSEGRLADDIQTEQEKIRAADLLIFQFPMYWMGFPAILKGWFDRVMTSGFAFDLPANIYDLAYLKNKKCILSFTAGGSSANYTPFGPWGDMDVNLWPIQCGALYFMGLDVLAPSIFYGCDPGQSVGEDPLGKWRDRLKTIFEEKALHFFKQSDYEPVQAGAPGLGLKLKESVIAETTQGGPYGPTTGQHVNRPLPPGQQTQIPK